MNHNLYGVSKNSYNIVKECELELKNEFQRIDEIKEYFNVKILKTFIKNKVKDSDFESKTGYCYDDIGRDKIESLYADVFGFEDALVRPAIASGTHAIYVMLSSLLNSGDELISITGTPYDTLKSVIGTEGSQKGNLISTGIVYSEISLKENGNFDIDAILDSITDKTKVIYIQRSRGYSTHKNFTISQLKETTKIIKEKHKDLIIAVDNCYCEFVSIEGDLLPYVDIMAGSLIKNPGGTLANSGGYIVGKKHLIEYASSRLYAPGLKKEIGSTFGTNRNILQGLYLAPTIVSVALKSALLFAKVFDRYNYLIYPKIEEGRQDIIQAVSCKSKDELIKICQIVQANSPIDSFVKPIPSYMPGYEYDIIMAAGTFIQGSSIELSADAPIRKPYTVYIQGGITLEQSKLILMNIVEEILGG